MAKKNWGAKRAEPEAVRIITGPKVEPPPEPEPTPEQSVEPMDATEVAAAPVRYVVAEGRALTTLRGLLRPGQVLVGHDFPNFDETIARLLSKGAIRRQG
jgi:hypothetical protein